MQFILLSYVKLSWNYYYLYPSSKSRSRNPNETNDTQFLSYLISLLEKVCEPVVVVEVLRKRVIYAHKCWERFKKLPKHCQAYASPLWYITRKFSTTVNLTSSGHSPRIIPRAQQAIWEVISPRTPGKHLGAFRPLFHWVMSVYEPSIWRTMKKIGIHDWLARRKPLLSKKNTAALEFTQTLKPLHLKCSFQAKTKHCTSA